MPREATALPVTPSPARKRLRKNPTEAWQRSLCVTLRGLQSSSNCSTRLIQRVLDELSPFFAHKTPRSVNFADKKSQEQAGCLVVKLFSCGKCDDPQVWTVRNCPESCPSCAAPLRDEKGDRTPLFWFPLQHRLRALLQTRGYRDLLQYERTRKRNDLYYTDVYDCEGKFISNTLCRACFFTNLCFVFFRSLAKGNERSIRLWSFDVCWWNMSLRWRILGVNRRMVQLFVATTRAVQVKEYVIVYVHTRKVFVFSSEKVFWLHHWPRAPTTSSHRYWWHGDTCVWFLLRPQGSWQIPTTKGM